jgi:MFS superfamily sulfate permease-like transporter
LLSVEAVDKLDPQKRTSDPNRELRAQGLGNLAASLLGGLPMTAVIVRSSANVNAGARSKASAMVHSALLLVAVLLIPSILNLIPLAALAAILIFTGYKLASPAMIKGMFKAGWNQFIPFAVTIVAILLTDLLKGIGVGMVVGIFYILRANYRSAYSLQRETQSGVDRIRIVLSEHVSFLNKASILLTLRRLPQGSVVEIDGSKSHVIDYDVLEIIHDFAQSAPERSIQVELKGISPVARAAGAH